MDRSLGDELYSDMLKTKTELDESSVHHVEQSHSLDVEDEDWCGDGSSDLDREWQRRKDQFHTIGYRDGLIAGKEASAQEGFNIGFKESVLAGYNWGLVRGVTAAINCLPGEIRDKIIESAESRTKFHHLYESVNKVSSTDAFKVFGDGNSLSTKEEEIGDWNVLDSSYRQLQSLTVECPAIKIQPGVKTIHGEESLLA